MIKEKIKKILEKIISKVFKKKVEIEINQPNNFNFGDYSSTIAFKLSKIEKKTPLEIAEKIKNNFLKNDFIEKIEVLKPGFINFWVSKSELINQLKNFLKNKFNIDQIYKGKKVIVEYTDPNILKEFHIGHLYSNIVGESIACIFQSMGANVRRANYQGDVGLHVAKAIWGIIQNMKKNNFNLDDIDKFNHSEKAKFMGQSYSFGTIEYEENEASKKEIIDLNKKIYDQSDFEINEIYNRAKKWSLEYFETIYQRLGTKFDDYYFESLAGKVGLEYVKENLKKGIFEKSNNAIVFKGEKYGLHTRVFINSLGLPTYEAKDLGLASTKYKNFPYDLSIIVVGNEVKEYFKVVLKALELINPELRKKTVNVFTGMVNLPEGKMSSRLGNIITAESLLDELHKKAWLKIQETTKTNFNGEFAYYSKEAKVKPSKQSQIAEAVAISAVKYALLKNSLGQNIEFNINESVSLDGNSGPYLLYTYVRCQSVLKKGNISLNNLILNLKKINKLTIDEINLIRKLYQFQEIVFKAAETLSPNIIANYLYELASQYNLFYQKNPILKTEKQTKELRLLITKATANTIKKGLQLLGIKTVDQM